MTRTKQILALIVSLVALAVAAPVASASNDADGRRSLESAAVKYKSLPGTVAGHGVKIRIGAKPDSVRVKFGDPDSIRVRAGRRSPNVVKIRF